MAGRCPSCGTALAEDQRNCPQCRRKETVRRTAVRRDPSQQVPAAEAAPTAMRRARETQLNMPRRIEGARYTFGTTWTSGSLYVTADGLYMLSDADGFADPEAIKKVQPPADNSFLKIGTLSFFAPVTSIQSVKHKSPLESWLIIDGRKVPVRLLAEGWDLIDLYCAMAGISVG